MVLSCSGDRPQYTNRIFDGSGDVHMFFFYLKNVNMRRNNHAERSIEFIGYLDSEAFELFFDKFTKNGKPNDDTKHFAKVKALFLEKFSRK